MRFPLPWLLVVLFAACASPPEQNVRPGINDDYTKPDLDVGTGGAVFAVEIADRLVMHLRARAAEKRLPQVQAVLGTVRDVMLPDGSTDVVFTCDTYHHFEYPRTTLASIHRALRPTGRFVVVDFERIPGKSRQWVLDHVRCGKQQVIDEVTAAGFTLVEEVPLALRENYFLRFGKR